MRKIVIVLMSLLLTACVDDSASYYVGGSNQHSLSLRRMQPYFWSDDVNLDLAVARLPDCQRVYSLGQIAADDVEIELFNSGDNIWTLRSGKQLWQVETQTCSQLPEPKGDAKGDPGELLGTFKPDGDKFVFEPVAAGATLPASAAPVAETAPTAPADAPAAADAAAGPNGAPAATPAPAAQ